MHIFAVRVMLRKFKLQKLRQEDMAAFPETKRACVEPGVSSGLKAATRSLKVEKSAVEDTQRFRWSMLKIVARRKQTVE
jgi:hypothetical protein